MSLEIYRQAREHDAAQRRHPKQSVVVVYCARCDYYLTVACSPQGTHGCAKCDGQMAVFVPQELMYRAAPTPEGA